LGAGAIFVGIGIYGQPIILGTATSIVLPRQPTAAAVAV
jgi:hypothetical protein